MAYAVVNGDGGRSEPIKKQRCAPVLKHCTEEVNNCGRVSQVFHVEQQLAHHGIGESAGDIQENDGDNLLPVPCFLDVEDQVKE